MIASYAAGPVAKKRIVGGLIGFNAGEVLASYATGRVTGNTRVGGLIGRLSDKSIPDSYMTSD